MSTCPANARAVAALFALGVTALPAGCGPEHGFTGVWQQNCDVPQGGCDEQPFVYALHIGRYGDSITGLLVRYLKADGALADFDPNNECGCYIMLNGRARDSGVTFSAALDPNISAGGPGCPVPEFDFNRDRCLPELRTPSCAELVFDLRGDSDLLEGQIRCGELAQDVAFVPAAGRPRRTCHENCTHLPETDGGAE